MWTIALWPSRRMVSTNPSAVNGLTKADAPCSAVALSGNSMTDRASTVRYCANMPPATQAIVLPSKACASAASPAATTVPAPSLPTGIACPTRAAIARRAPSGIVATMRPSPYSALSRSAGPKSRPRSDGLIGAASTRTTTSCPVGGGRLSSASSTISRPSSCKVVKIRRPRMSLILSSCIVPQTGRRRSGQNKGRLRARVSGGRLVAI